MTVADLNARFAIPGVLAVVAGNEGLAAIRVTTSACTATVYLQGAHVTSFIPASEPELLFVSRSSYFAAGKAIRGGIPICFPWFTTGADPAHPKSPSHGTARLTAWELTRASQRPDGAVEITLQLPPDPALPATASVLYDVTFSKTLEARLQVENATGAEITFEEALHTYLKVGDVRQISISGLENQSFLNSVNQEFGVEAQPIVMTQETDRIYGDSAATCVLMDPVMKRRITVEKSNSLSTVVWNPWVAKAAGMKDFRPDEWPGMVCIETANVRKNAITLPPGQRHVMGVRLSAEAV